MSNDSLRLDRWLWFTRFYKTRTAASAAVHGGHVRVNGEPVRSAHRIRVGDQVRLVREQLAWEFEIRELPSRRGPAREARACYEETAESVARREQAVAELRRDRLQMPMTRGRPDKHTRRKLRDRNRGR